MPASPAIPETIRWLNVVLKNELTAINQYFLHSRMLADWGLSELSKKEHDESIDEMKHADKLIQRIPVPGRPCPTCRNLGKLLIGENVQEVIACDLALETDSYPDLKNAIVHCENIRDFGSRELFVEILESEERAHRLAPDATASDRADGPAELRTTSDQGPIRVAR